MRFLLGRDALSGGPPSSGWAFPRHSELTAVYLHKTGEAGESLRAIQPMNRKVQGTPSRGRCKGSSDFQENATSALHAFVDGSLISECPEGPQSGSFSRLKSAHRGMNRVGQMGHMDGPDGDRVPESWAFTPGDHENPPVGLDRKPCPQCIEWTPLPPPFTLCCTTLLGPTWPLYCGPLGRKAPRGFGEAGLPDPGEG